ncbi:biotin-dependent carboxyltransferase family protein [Fusobacterium sp. PH5-44]|uniref:5-oxoprolinase subunit C family protein n=1 Tax=unclassified Fusobacterium TaxID=2648384 RepID=UPI003D20C3CF
MNGIKILDAGLLSSVQDLGRYGYQRSGVSTTGVMDEFASRVANKLLGNDENAAVIETTMKGISFEFLNDGAFAVTGGNCETTINGTPIKLWVGYKCKKGDIVKMGICKGGLRNYIAFAGGIDVPIVMNSRTTNLKAKIGGVNGRKLVINDEIEVFPIDLKTVELKKFNEKYIPKYSKEINVRVILGQQVDEFTEKGIKTLFDGQYSITNESDRMGMRLLGEAIEHKVGADIISDGMTIGAVQVPGNGQPIIMMSDRQTTGGYTKIGNVISVDLPVLAQAMPGTKIKFVEINRKDAVELLRKREIVVSDEKNYMSRFGVKKTGPLNPLPLLKRKVEK